MIKTYKITIDPAVVVDEVKQGFIDNVKVQDRIETLEGLTVEQCFAKRRGNFRWTNILNSLSLVANPTILSVEAVDATAEGEATSFTFTASFVNEAATSIVREDETIIGVEALEVIIAEALTIDAIKHCTIPDPTNGMIEFILDLEVGSLADTVEQAMELITVTEL